MLDDKGKQLRPCIVAKAKYALGIPSNLYKGNKSRCTHDYWYKVLRILAKKYNIQNCELIKARSNTDLFIKGLPY